MMAGTLKDERIATSSVARRITTARDNIGREVAIHTVRESGNNLQLNTLGATIDLSWRLLVRIPSSANQNWSRVAPHVSTSTSMLCTLHYVPCISGHKLPRSPCCRYLPANMPGDQHLE